MSNVQNVFLVGAKSLGAYGGYETFVYKLTEYHQNNPNIKYHVACKANGDKTSEKTFSVDVSKATGSRYSVLGFDAGGKKIVDSGWQTGKIYTLGKDVASYRLLFSYSDNRSLSSADTLKFENCLTLSTVQNNSSVIEVGTVGADGKNVAATNRARTVVSYKTSEKAFSVDVSKVAGSRWEIRWKKWIIKKY